MAREMVIDRLITEFGFRTDTRALGQLESRIDSVRRRLDGASRMAIAAGTAVTGALFGIGAGMVGFDREMNRLQRDTNASAEEMAEMRDRVIELGSSADYTTISVTDAGRALRELRKAGLDHGEALEALPDVLNLVAATEIDVGAAATNTAKVMKAYGLTVRDIPYIHDLLAHAQVTTGITAEQLIDTLLRIGPTARTAGIDIRDTASMLALLVDQGQIAERTATSLERAFVQLSKADVLPPAALEAFEELGVDIEHIQYLMAQGKIIDAFEELAAAGLDVSTASRIFGEDGQRAVLTIAAEMPRLRSIREGVDDIDGSMRRQADTMNQGLAGAWAAFQSSLSAAREALGDAGLRGWLERASNEVRLLVERFTALPFEVRRSVGMFLMAGPVLIGIGIALKGISIALGALLPLLRTVRWLAITAFGPWGIAIAAVAAAAYFLVTEWESLVAWFEDRFPGVAETVESVGEAVRQAWGGAVAWMRDTWASAANVDFDWQRLADSAEDVDWHGVGIAIGEAIAGGVQAAPGLWEAFDSMTARWEAAIIDWATNVDWGVLWVRFRVWGASVGEAFKDGLVSFFSGLGDFFYGIVEGATGIDLRRKFAEWENTIEGGASTVGDALGTGAQAVVGMGSFAGTFADPAYAQAIAAAAGPGGTAPPAPGRTPPNVSVTIDRIEVTAPEGADGQQLGREAGAAAADVLREQVRNAYEDFDSDVAR